MEHIKDYRPSVFLFLLSTLLLLTVSIFLDQPLAEFMPTLQQPLLTGSMIWLTNVWYLIGIIFFALYTVFFPGKFQKETIIMIWSVLISTLIATYLIKAGLGFTRPEITPTTLLQEYNFGFPSTHVALVACLIPIIKWYKNKYTWIVILLTCLIAFSRMYVGVHYFTDVLGGAIIGVAIGWFATYIQLRFAFFTRMLNLCINELEMRRQIFHFIFGLILIFLIHYKLLTVAHLGILTLIGGVLSLAAKKRKLPLLTRVLHFFEREHHLRKFPGRGIFYFTFGAFLTMLFFGYDTQIVEAAIIILAVGDSLTNIIGRYIGKWTLPYNPKKNLEGPLIAGAIAAIAAMYFVAPLPAIIATFIAMIVETFHLKIGKLEIDDNVTIPLVAALVLSILV